MFWVRVDRLETSAVLSVEGIWVYYYPHYHCHDDEVRQDAPLVAC
jgi:hypothetical protein